MLVSGAGATGLSLGAGVDSQTLAIQRKADDLYEQGEYERAFFIYKNELAPIGDKYAQYMVGYMYLTGTGVAKDAILASAWYRLAAEREQPEFVDVRDQLLKRLDEADLVRSDTEFRELRQAHSDLVLLLDLLRGDLEALEPQTGSRLTGSSAAVTTIDPRSGSIASVDQLPFQVRERATQRLKALGQLLGTDIETDIDKVSLSEVSQRVRQAIATISDR